jgi:ubiquinone/menaquinone biosynthesis C-methylase UbiE
MKLSNPDQNPAEWSTIVSSYEETFEPFTRQYAMALLQSLELKSGDKVIDVAAGTGAFSLMAARKGINVLATDFSAGMISRLRERIRMEELDSIRAEVMDGQSLAVPDSSFDAAVSVLGLIFFPDIQQGLSEMCRVVRPHGSVGVVCWGDPGTFILMSLLVRAIRQVLPEFQPPAEPIWARMAGAGLVRTHLEQAGLTQVSVMRTRAELPVESPQKFWSGFMRSVPPVKELY